MVSEDGKANGVQLAMEKLAFKSRKGMTSILMGCQEKRMREERTMTYKNSSNYQSYHFWLPLVSQALCREL